MNRETTPKEYKIREDKYGNIYFELYLKNLSEYNGRPEYKFAMAYNNCVAFQYENSTEYVIIAVNDILKLDHYRKLRKVMTYQELKRKYDYDGYICVSYFDTRYYDFERAELEGELNDR